MKYRFAIPLLVALAILSAACMPIGAQQVQRITISKDGCTAEGYCPWGGKAQANFFYQPTHEVVLGPNQGAFQVLHEFCHTWQGRLCPDSDDSLSCWADTPEGRAFPTTPPPSSWYLSGDSKLEDAANTCAEYQLDSNKLKTLSPERYSWATEYLP